MSNEYESLSEEELVIVQRYYTAIGKGKVFAMLRRALLELRDSRAKELRDYINEDELPEGIKLTTELYEASYLSEGSVGVRVYPSRAVAEAAYEQLAALRAFVGSEVLRSDFQTVAEMRAALDALRASVLRIATACENCTSLSELRDWARDALKGVPLPEGPCSPVVCEKLERLEAKVARARERITECVEIYGGTAHLSLDAFDAELGTGAQDKIQIPSDAEKAAILDDMAAVLRKHGFLQQCNDEALDYILGDYAKLRDTVAQDDIQRTHHAECWRHHLPCAVARIELVRTAIQFRIDQVCRREGIGEATKEHQVAPEVAAEINALQYARLCWDRAMRGEGGGDDNS